jgi:hypothetical protein
VRRLYDPRELGTFSTPRCSEVEGEGTHEGKNVETHCGIFAFEYYGH